MDSRSIIICIDDEAIVLDALGMELEGKFEGVDIELVEEPLSIDALIDELQGQGYDIPVVICDYIMPKIKGDEVLIKLQSKIPMAKKIMLTGQSSIEGMANALNHASLYRYMQKPWDSKDLILTVTQAMQSYVQDRIIEKQNGELRGLNEELHDKVEQLQVELVRRLELEKEREIQQAVMIQQTKLAELGAMIGAIAHQWKQPLNYIYLAEQMLIGDFDDNELSRDALVEHSKGVMKSVDFMLQTMDDFRNFYKPSNIKKEFFLLAEIKNVLALFVGDMKNENITIDAHGDEQLYAVGYSGEFKQVILNLINNAKDAFIENDIQDRLIDINVNKNGDFVRVCIADNAGGIAPHIKSSIFDPFSSTKGEKGTGIGLSLAKMIIEDKMHGKISVENISNGARFTLELPILS